jgi:hypothetical protein
MVSKGLKTGDGRQKTEDGRRKTEVEAKRRSCYSGNGRPKTKKRRKGEEENGRIRVNN